jgi:hypothetical protein
MTRVMTRELEQLIGGVIPRYKGVRWCPEHKHPWVVEIKIPRKAKTKVWLLPRKQLEHMTMLPYDVESKQLSILRTLVSTSQTPP